MTTAAKQAPRYYVATESDGVIRLRRYATKDGAILTAKNLHSNCVIAPLVVCAPDIEAAREKARRCYNREITCREARSA